MNLNEKKINMGKPMDLVNGMLIGSLKFDSQHKIKLVMRKQVNW